MGTNDVLGSFNQFFLISFFFLKGEICPGATWIERLKVN